MQGKAAVMSMPHACHSAMLPCDIVGDSAGIVSSCDTIRKDFHLHLQLHGRIETAWQWRMERCRHITTCEPCGAAASS